MEKKKRNLLLGMLLVLIVASIILLQDRKEELELNPLGKAQEFQGIHAWINSDPLSIYSLEGKIVLVDFWTYTCINCIRTLPFIKEWDEKYRDKGLVIVGVHSPEFFFERKLENVREAVERHGIKYAVALDNDFKTWRAYNNRFWPRKYLIDKDGNIRYDHIGEGAYEETEKVIQQLLSELGEDVDVETVRDPEKDLLPLTRELYAGYNFARVRLGNEENYNPEKSIDYKIPEEFKNDLIYLSGKWFNGQDNLRCGDEECYIYLKFLARSVNIVASSDGESMIELTLDDEALEKNNKGKDVELKNGKSIIEIKESRMYNLVGDQNVHGRYLLKIKAEKGFSFNAFTFG